MIPLDNEHNSLFSQYTYLIILVISILLVFILYLYVRPKSLDVSHLSPFSDVVGKALTTKKRSIIATNPDNQRKRSKNVLEDGTGYKMADLTKITDIPIGTSMKINSVELHYGRVSGTTSAYIFGTVYLDSGISYDFEKTWGYYNSLYEDKPYWVFEQSVWQDSILDGKYYLPKI